LIYRKCRQSEAEEIEAPAAAAATTRPPPDDDDDEDEAKT